MFTIIANYPDFIAIDKSPGVGFHKDEENSGLISCVRKATNNTDLFPVHRLDKITSGILLFAKNKAAASELAVLFSKRSIEKYYLAIADQKPKKKQGLIIGDMKRSRRGTWQLCHSKNNPALTQFFSSAIAPGQRLFVLRPLTGKTHQLRVALKSIGAPVFGDDLYHSKNKVTSSTLDRGYLHSYCIRFTWHGELCSICCKPTIGKHFISQQFNNALNQFQEPWKLPWPHINKL